MKDYLSMDEAELRAELEAVRGQYQGFCGMDLRLDMSRGKPCPEQLDLSQEMLRMVDNYTCLLYTSPSRHAGGAALFCRPAAP